MNYEDTEDHRLAALGVGYQVKHDSELDTDWLMNGDQVVAVHGQWNPKTDKGASFDLMIAAKLCVFLVPEGVGVTADKGIAIFRPFISTQSTQETAMHAIFYAAVAKGKQKEVAGTEDDTIDSEQSDWEARQMETIDYLVEE